MTGRGIVSRGLLVYAVAVGVLSGGCVIGKITRSREMARRMGCVLRLKTIYMAGIYYAMEDDHADKFPYAGGDDLGAFRLLADEVDDPSTFTCPASAAVPSAGIGHGAGRAVLGAENLSYEGFREALSEQDAERPLAWDKAGNHAGGRNVLFANGMIEFLTEERFQALIGKKRGGGK